MLAIDLHPLTSVHVVAMHQLDRLFLAHYVVIVQAANALQITLYAEAEAVITDMVAIVPCHIGLALVAKWSRRGDPERQTARREVRHLHLRDFFWVSWHWNADKRVEAVGHRLGSVRLQMETTP